MTEVIAGLNVVLDHIDRARTHLIRGYREWTRAARGYVGTLDGSGQQDADDIRAICATVDAASLQRVLVILFTAEARIADLLQRYRGRRTPRSCGLPPERAESVEPVAIANGHGDRYPPGASGLAENLPPRLIPRSGNRTVGISRADGKLAASVESGYDEDLSEAITTRLDKLGIRSTYLKFHVEMKVAEMMIRADRRQVDLAINNVPCGVEVQRGWPDSCDRVLDRFLPPGFVLTVYGTTADNRPWSKTYGTGRWS